MLAILAMPDGEWRVSPAYSMPSTVPYGNTTLALSMLGRTSGLSRRLLLEFAAAIGPPDRSAVKVLDRLLAKLEGLEDRLRAALPFAQNTVADLIAELRHRRRLAIV